MLVYHIPMEQDRESFTYIGGHICKCFGFLVLPKSPPPLVGEVMD